jgi:N,N'-diacetyllegionaminate synthase
MSIFVIAEVGSTHDGSFGNAIRAADAAADAGVDAVKYQTHIAEAETLANAPAPAYFKGEPRMEYFKRTGFSLEQWKELAGHCATIGVEFMSSPFSIAAVELLEQVDMPHYKIPSGEVTNLPMLDVVGQTGKPVLLSSGMSDWREIDAAVETLRKYHDQITVLQCTTSYPCEPEDVGFNVMAEMRDRYGLPVGFSDHTKSIFAPIAAASLGASVIEKHFTMSKWLYGSDAWNSLEPPELAMMVTGIREVESMVGSVIDKDDIAGFAEMKQIFQKSIVSAVDIPAGTTLVREMIAEKKPGTGIPAARLADVLGSNALTDIPAGVLITADQIDASL